MELFEALFVALFVPLWDGLKAAVARVFTFIPRHEVTAQLLAQVAASQRHSTETGGPKFSDDVWEQLTRGPQVNVQLACRYALDDAVEQLMRPLGDQLS